MASLHSDIMAGVDEETKTSTSEELSFQAQCPNDRMTESMSKIEKICEAGAATTHDIFKAIEQSNTELMYLAKNLEIVPHQKNHVDDSWNLIFYGVSEEDNEENARLYQRIDTLLQENLQIKAEDLKIDKESVCRMVLCGNACRPIMAKFTADKTNLRRLTCDKNGKLASSGICIGIQCSHSPQTNREQLKNVKESLQQEDIKMRESDGKLIVADPTINIQILVWNIQGLITKRADGTRKFPDVSSYILDKKYDVVLLSETQITPEHEEKNNGFKITGYECTHFYAEKTRATPRGGLSCYVKSSQHTRENIYVENTNDKTDKFMWIKIKKSILSRSDSDVHICHTYIHLKKPTEMIIALCDQIKKKSRDGTRNIFVCGDLNSHTSNVEDSVNIDILVGKSSLYFPTTGIPTRENRHKKIENSGRSLIKLCHETGLRIVNGRLHNDKIGNFTFRSVSTTDYLLTRAENFELVETFDVLKKENLSDHLPLLFSLLG